MPDITINERLWTVGEARLDDGTVVRRGETVSVSDADWKLLSERRTRQMGSKHRTFQIAEAAPPDDRDRLWVRIEDLVELSGDELRDMATARGIPVSGTKSELADRIRTFEQERAAAKPATPETG